MKRPGWTRLSAAGCKLSTTWRHDASGWLVKHCGHQTANWPFYLVDPNYSESLTMSHNGRGFLGARKGIEAVEAILAGSMVATNDSCVPGVRRVVKAAA